MSQPRLSAEEPVAGDEAVRRSDAPESGPAPAGAADGGPITLRDANGVVRLSLDLLDGQPSLSLSDASGRVRAALRLTADGALALALHDQSGQRTAGAVLAPPAPEWLSLVSDEERRRVGLEHLLDGRPHVCLCDGEGRVVATLP